MSAQFTPETLSTLDSRDKNTSYLQNLLFFHYHPQLSNNLLIFLLIISGLMILLLMAYFVYFFSKRTENMKNIFVSLSFQVYYFLFFQITFSLSLASLNENSYTALLALIFSVAICLIYSLHEYDYRFVQKDYLSTRNIQLKILLVFIEAAQLLLRKSIPSNTYNIINLVFNAIYSYLDAKYLPYYNNKIQTINTAGCLFNFIVSINLLLSVYLTQWKILNMIFIISLPLSFRAAQQIYNFRCSIVLEKILYSDLRAFQFNSQKKFEWLIDRDVIQFYVRYLLSFIQLDFDQYLTSKSSIILDYITTNHFINCHSPQHCFCSQNREISELSKKSTRSKYINYHIEKLFEHSLKSFDAAGELSFNYLMFIADILENPAKCIVQVINLANQSNQNWLANQKVFTILQYANQKLKKAQKNKNADLPINSQSYFEMITYDEKVIMSFKLLKQYLEKKKQALQEIGCDQVNLVQIQLTFQQTRSKRNELFKILAELTKKYYTNQSLYYLVEIFESTFTFDKRLGILLNKKRQSSFNLIKSEDTFDDSMCAVFASLTNVLGQVKKVSNNFERIVPLYSNSEVIGKNISFMIPNEIAQTHDKIIMSFIQNFTAQKSSYILNLQIGKDKEGWGIPYSIKIQISQVGLNDFGMSALIQQKPDSNIYLSINLKKAFQILVMQKKFYQTFLQHFLSEQAAKTMRIDTIIPAFEKIFILNKGNNKDFREFQAIIVRPSNLEEYMDLQLGDLSAKNIDGLIYKQLFLISGEYQSIENPFVSFIQLKITNFFSIDDKSSKSYEIQKLKKILQSQDIYSVSESSVGEKEEYSNDVLNNFQKLQDIQQILLSPLSKTSINNFAKIKNEQEIMNETKRGLVNNNDQCDSPHIFSYREIMSENFNQSYIQITNDATKISNNLISPQSLISWNSRNKYIQNSLFKQPDAQDEIDLINQSQERVKDQLNQDNSFAPKNIIPIKKVSQLLSDSTLRNDNEKDFQKPLSILKQNTQFNVIEQTPNNQDQSSFDEEKSSTQQAKDQTLKHIQDCQVEQSVHSQQSGRSFKREHIINQINQRQQITGLFLIKICRICLIILFFILNFITFYYMQEELLKQKDDYQNIDWGSRIRTTTSSLISDQNIQKLLKVPYFAPPKALATKIFSDVKNYQTQRHSIFKSLIMKYEKSDKTRTNLYKNVLNQKQNLTFAYSATKLFNSLYYFGYIQTAVFGYMYQVSYGLDPLGENELQISLNYVETSNQLEVMKKDVQQQLSSQFESIEQITYYSLITLMSASFLISLSFLFLYGFISKKKEDILILLATIQPEKLIIMLGDTMQYLSLVNSFIDQQSKIILKQKKSSQSQNSKFKMNLKSQFNTSNIHKDLIKKRKLISNTNQIPKFNIKILVFACIFFVLTQMQSVSVFFIAKEFKNNQLLNRNFVGKQRLSLLIFLLQFFNNKHQQIIYNKQTDGLTDLNDFIISISGIRIPLVLLKLSNNKDLFKLYQDRLKTLMSQLNTIQNSVYNNVENQYSASRYRQSEFNEYVFRVLEKDACNAVNENLSLVREEGFNYEQCISIKNGIFNTGLVKSVQYFIDLFKSRQSVFYEENTGVFLKQILQQEQELYIYETYYYRIYFGYIIQTIYQLVQNITMDHYSYILTINYIFGGISLTMFTIIIYLVYTQFFSAQINQLTETKRLLDIIDIQVIEENQYIMNYFKFSK